MPYAAKLKNTNHAYDKSKLTYKPAQKQREREEENEAKEQAADPTRLFPLPNPKDDEDDIQEFFVPPSPTREIPADIDKKEVHMPDDAVLADDQFDEDKGKKGERKRGQIDQEAKQFLDDRMAMKGRTQGNGLASMLPEPDEKNRYGLKSRGPKLRSTRSGNAWDEQLQELCYYQPRAFEELMEEITQWYILKGKDYQIFPFRVLRCTDYLWLCMGKRRTGKTTLYVFLLTTHETVHKLNARDYPLQFRLVFLSALVPLLYFPVRFLNT